MNRIPAAMAALLLAQAAAFAQTSVRLYTRPVLPSPEALDRMHLRMAWRSYVPTGGPRDGIFSVQLIDNQVFVQTLAGGVTAIDADSGVTLWSVNVGVPYKITHRVAANKQSIFAVRSGYLYDIDRKTGHVRWEFRLPGAPSAAPAADESRLFLALGTGHFYVYLLPEAADKEETKLAAAAGGAKNEPSKSESSQQEFNAAAAGGRLSVSSLTGRSPGNASPQNDRFREEYNAAAASGRVSWSSLSGHTVGSGPQPELLFDYMPETRIERAPLLTDDRVVLAGSDGTFFIISKALKESPHIYRTAAEVTAPIGHHAALTEDEMHLDEIAYVASRDYNIYAVDTVKGRVNWRFTAGSPIYHKPEVTDDAVYVTAERTGLYRLDRLSGRQQWHNPNAQQFLAQNKKFVYARDRSGRLLILDRARGSQRAAYDASAFVVPVSNEWTDRLFLAANDGLIVCLHDRDYAKPLVTKTVPERKAPPEEKADAKPEAKPKEPAKDEGMDEDKKKEERKPLPKPKSVKKEKDDDK